MKRILIVLSLSLALPAAVCWSVCCTSITAGPAAWAPEYSKTGCGTASKAFYGGTGQVLTDASGLYQTTTIQASKLYQMVPGRPNVLVASNTINRDVNCNNVTTVLSSWNQTPTCAILPGKANFTRYSVTTTACAASPATTVTVDSVVTTSP